MSYKIILDSCGELTEEMALSGHFTNVPLTLEVGEYRVVDDETFNQAAFLNAVASTTASRTVYEGLRLRLLSYLCFYSFGTA